MQTISIDIDDVTGILVAEWLRLYNYDYKDNVSEENILSWQIDKYVKCGKKIYDYLKYPSLYDNVKPVRHSLMGITRLRHLGYRIIFVTASTPEQSGRKYKWLLEYNLIDERKNYIEAVDKSLIATDYLIDDNPDNVINAHRQGIIFDKPWNTNLNGYPRVYNWLNIMAYFENELEKETV